MKQYILMGTYFIEYSKYCRKHSLVNLMDQYTCTVRQTCTNFKCTVRQTCTNYTCTVRQTCTNYTCTVRQTCTKLYLHSETNMYKIKGSPNIVFSCIVGINL